MVVVPMHKVEKEKFVECLSTCILASRQNLVISPATERCTKPRWIALIIAGQMTVQITDGNGIIK
jgi:hypothetical protein